MGIRVRAKTLKTLFTNAAFGLFDIMTDTHKVKPVKTIKVNVSADNLDELLQGWLSALLSKWSLDNELLSGFKIIELGQDAPPHPNPLPRGERGQAKDFDNIRENGYRLLAMVKGEHYDAQRHRIKTEIKAVTFHGLQVLKTKPGYQAQVIFDV
jgi:SHS2 domain-containing protein